MGNFWKDFWAQDGTGKERVLSLPYPPSVNHLWRHVVIRGAVRTLMSKEGREYKAKVRGGVVRGESDTFAGRLAVRIIVCPPDRRKRDIENVCKILCDSLSREIKGGKVAFPGVWFDDSQIDVLHVERGPVHRGGGYVLVYVREIAEVAE